MEKGERRANISRETWETKVDIELSLDGTGVSEVSTGIGMLDHLLAQLSEHGCFDIKLKAKGDLEVDEHHLVEDVAISLGQAFKQALGEGRGIVRIGHSIVPMDEALALVAVDLSGRGYAKIEVSFSRERVGKLPTDLISHFFHSFSMEGRFNLYANLLSGVNDHHKVEALFKALGRALGDAIKIDERIKDKVPSTKGVIN